MPQPLLRAIDPAFVEIARRELTDKQLHAWELHVSGCSLRDMSYRLDVARTTVGDRLDSAPRQLRRHGVLFAPDGQPYLPQKV